MEPVGAWQRVCVGERVGKCRDWFFEQVEDRLVRGIPQRLRERFDLVPGPIREAEYTVTY
jgi:hypothetical protein